MKKSVEATGKTLEDAIKAAVDELGVDADSVSVEVLENPKSGFLGFRSVPARVRVSYEISNNEKIEEFLKGLLERMGSDAEITVTDEGENSYKVELHGSDMGMLIGRRGETLDAIQHITNYCMNKGDSSRMRISIDAENYRKKRDDSLVHLAEKVAAKVIKYRKNVTLEPMNAYERHVIHVALQDKNEVTTFSTGKEPNRRIVVAYSKYKSVPTEEE
ncbi:MAG: protein jag [Oscillospiraceae bacterium]|nr:protein jag [Oscillospiraceae bacterium]